MPFGTFPLGSRLAAVHSSNFIRDLTVREALFLGFAGLVTVASLYNIFNGPMFPEESDPTGGRLGRPLIT